MALLLVLLHPSGLPHADALGLPVWAQWLAVGVVFLIGVWLVLDGRASGSEEPAPDRLATNAGEPPSIRPTDEDSEEALVVGRSARRATPAEPDRVLPRAPSMPVSASGARLGAASGWPAALERYEVAPGAVRSFSLGDGRLLYVAAGMPEIECESGGLRLHRANVPHLGGEAPLTTIEPGLMVRLAAGDLVLPAPGVRLLAGNATDRPAALVVLGTKRAAAGWLNPIRMLTLFLGVGAGILALDRARAVVALTSSIGTGGSLNVSRLGFAFAALLLVGGALAPTAPRLAALVLLAAAGTGAFLATAGRWEERLEWWGAEYVLTAWTHLPFWAAGAFGFALLAVAGWRYRTRGTLPRLTLPRSRRARRRVARAER